MKRQYSFQKPIWKFVFPIVDQVGDLVIGSRNKQHAMPDSIQKILVMRLDHMGDGILLMPFVEALRKKFPAAQIFGLFSKEIAQVFEGYEGLSKVWVMENHWFSRAQTKSGGESQGKILADIQKEGIDLGFDPRGDIRNIRFLVKAGVKYRVGYGSGGGGFLLNLEAHENEHAHETDRNIRLGEAFHLARHEASCLLKIGELPEELTHTHYVVIHTGAGTQAKLWPKERWIHVIENITARGMTVALVGKGEIEEHIAHQFKDNASVKNYVGKLVLSDLWKVIRGAQLYVGCDSGLAHGAGILAAKTLVLESSTNESERWRVLGPRVIRLREPVFCSPCHLTRCRFRSHDCMERITEDRVVSHLDQMLSR